MSEEEESEAEANIEGSALETMLKPIESNLGQLLVKLAADLCVRRVGLEGILPVCMQQ